MTFERQPKQPQEMTEMNEVQEYYAVKNNSCHTFTIETYNGGETWHVAATGNEHREAWLAEAELENMLMDRGYQVFYSIEDAEEYMREMDRDTEGELNLPQDEETSEQRIERYREQLAQPCDETPEEKELLDTVERLILVPGGCVYYNGDSVSFCKRSWQDICLVAHYDDDMSWMVHERSSPAYRVVDLMEWDRRDALDAIRSLHERLATV